MDTVDLVILPNTIHDCLYVCVIDQAPGQYRPIHARAARPYREGTGHVSSTVLPPYVRDQ